MPTRELLARACAAALNAERPAFVSLNNKAEGSAPLSALKLAHAIIHLRTVGNAKG